MRQKLVAFFLWLVKESIKSEYVSEMHGGHACRGLIDDITLMGVEHFVNRITEGNGTEYRLNSAGLKLYIDINKGLGRVKVRIGGDQAKDYPKFVVAVDTELHRRALDDDAYYAKNSIVWRNLN